MSWTLAGTVQFRFDEEPANVSADGNTAAWCCPCGSPVLFVYASGKPGSDASHPAPCHGCQTEYHLDPPFGKSPEPRPGIPIAPSTVMTIVKK